VVCGSDAARGEADGLEGAVAAAVAKLPSAARFTGNAARSGCGADSGVDACAELLESVMTAWTWLVPALSSALLVGVIATGAGPLLEIACAAGVVGAVFAAVHHAEVVAHRVGEPFGTLVLAVAVTVIEASLILSMMLAGGDDVAVLARDTIYAAVMIICNGVVGICVLVGGLAHREQAFRVEGAGAGFAALIAMSFLTLVLPDFTTTTPEGTYSTSQLVFVAIASVALWAVFVFVQTSRHRDYFLPAADATNSDTHAPPPTDAAAWASFGLLVVSLCAVVGLAKVLSPAIERTVAAAGAPKAVIGIVIAMLVLLPETLAAVQAARANRLQTSMNLAIGSALASIGLTVPAVVIAAIIFQMPLIMGLAPKDLVMLLLTFLVSTVTLGTGRTYLMQGAVHLVIFAAFLFLALVP
jgi:Ca2+:H+ antiporter